MISVTYFFVDFLDSANTRDTTSKYQVNWFFIQVLSIFYEVYTLITIWRVFNYVCDVLMDAELRQKGIIVTLPTASPVGTMV
uniref:Bestrophin homolog n=1 Tax=Acrobeloides nanus TaxID=290746 RepID=A0A914CIC0_9BILA